MQIKTIKKTISDKMTDWLSSITDQSLRADVKDNLLVSGGSIVSLLLNQKVNDYDVYLQDRSVLLRLTNYYVTQIEGPKVLDGHCKDGLVSKLEKQYQYVADDISEIYNQYSIALRNLKEDQIKLFMYGGGMRVNEAEANDEGKYVVKYFSPNAISLSDNIQIVIRFHGTPEEIHKTFDYIHATNYFTFDKGVVTNIAALESIITKQLKYQGSQYPVTSIIRMKKFIKRDWNISAGEILKMAFQVSQLDLSDPDTLEEQLIGVDVAYFAKLIDILRGVDKDTLTSQYLNTIIDRVFSSSEECDNEEEQARS
jgi:hypothetical protein